jgi:bla regulator protein blaR1
VYALVVGKGGFKLREIEYRGTGPTRLMRKGTMVELSYPAGADLAQFAGFLSGQAGRPVVDRTGLTGVFDIKLEFAPEPPVPLPDAGTDRPPNDTAGPSIFTAVQEQLGLRLESSRGLVETLVIDHAEKPDAN